MGRCCTCNGVNAVCKRCACVRAGRPCFSCLPLSKSRCVNANANGGVSLSVSHSLGNGEEFTDTRNQNGCRDRHMSSFTDVSGLSSQNRSNSIDSNDGCDLESVGKYLELHEMDAMMCTAYGAPLIHSEGPNVMNVWYNRWLRIVKLSGKLYDLPGGASGRKYVVALTDEILHLVSANFPSERLIVFSAVLLQRDRSVKKAYDIRRLIDRRLLLWKDNKFDILIQEAERCDKSLRSKRSVGVDPTHISKVFTRLMLLGKVRAAVRWLTGCSMSGLLLPNDIVGDIQGSSEDAQELTVFEALKLKHPNPQPACKSALLDGEDLPQLEDIEVTGSMVHKAAFAIQGGAGPGGCNANHWQDVLLRYGSSSDRLRDSIASLIRYLANSLVPWDSVRALLANRLIALDKKPGVRPIGIGETLRRLVSKVVCMVTRDDVETTCGSDQLCAGVKMGVEGAIHAAGDLFQSCDSDWGLLTIDASNAFNSINRNTLLWNVRILWPRAARYIFNTYRGWSPLIVREAKDFLYSKEGVTQGDPISMYMYAIATLPLIRTLKDISKWTQIWYADDSCVGGSLSNIKEWFNHLCKVGPTYGYYPKPCKSYLIVNESNFANAKEVFKDTDVKIVKGGRLLGGFVGDKAKRDLFVTEKVQTWCKSIEKLVSISHTQPQAAYHALVKSIQSEWIFLQRVTPDCSVLFAGIEHMLADGFLPSLFGCDISINERKLFKLPVRFGGLDMKDPTLTSESSYLVSREATSHLVQSILGTDCFDPTLHEDQTYSVRVNHKIACNDYSKQVFSDLLLDIDPVHQRIFNRAKDSLSAWLVVLPIERDNFHLTTNEFRDGLALRYGKPLLQLPPRCDGCGSEFSMNHALDCKKGGLIVQRHNEIRDVICDLAGLVWKQIIREPIINDSSETNEPSLVGDIAIRGVWQPQATAFFDIRVIDTDAKSYASISPDSVVRNAERDKKKKYSEACADRHVSFTPLCFSVDGLVGGEAKSFMEVLGHRLASLWNRPYSNVIHWLRAKMSFALVRAADLCLRGTRSKLRQMNYYDGAPIDPFIFHGP